MERVDAAVIGAGVIGLAIARALALSSRTVVILEREASFGTVTSARNSEVIHAGLHYPHRSLKERLCIAGKRSLYAFCESRHVPHRRCGKLTFAGTPAELARLEAIANHAREAEADTQLTWLDPTAARKIEPALDCAGALLSPSSGIIDSHAYMLALLGEAEDQGAMLARQTKVERIARTAGGWRIHAGGTAIETGTVVNAAGLGAQGVARVTEGLGSGHIPPLHLAKGNYFTYAGRVPFNRLIYPLPVDGGLGVHLTLDMAGQARFGPDLEWVAQANYAVDPSRGEAFLAAVQRFWPDIDPSRLAPGYAGIRPRLMPPGQATADFVIEGETSHGLPGLVNLFGIESPGLTASLAIAEHVLALC